MSANIAAAAAVAESLQQDLAEISETLAQIREAIAKGNINGAIGTSITAENAVERLTTLYPALQLLLRQERDTR